MVALGPVLPQLPKEPQSQGRHVGLPHTPKLPVLWGTMGSERGSTQPGQVSTLPAGADPGRNEPCSLGTLEKGGKTWEERRTSCISWPGGHGDGHLNVKPKYPRQMAG